MSPKFRMNLTQECYNAHQKRKREKEARLAAMCVDPGERVNDRSKPENHSDKSNEKK